ncbi:MAG: YeeE/YedE family protein [Reyranellaceae bacterium]
MALRFVLSGAIALATVIAAWLLSGRQGDGASLALSLILGLALGLAFQRSRFCFFCHARDFIEKRDPRGLLAILLALAIGAIGYHFLFGAWLPKPIPPRMPPDAFIGPVSWVLALAGIVFGIGMAVSGSCISAHLYRLGEGAPASPFALIGAVVGLGLGFVTWNSFYLTAVAGAPSIWLPHHLGYGGSLLLQLAALATLAVFLMRYLPATATEVRPPARSLAEFLPRLFEGRWPYWTGGVIVGVIGFAIVLRLPPLGVTAALSAAAREGGNALGALPQRLEGLDLLKGCATLIQSGLLSPNLMLILGIVLGGFVGGIGARQFTPVRPQPRDMARGLLGGVLLGWGATTALGCTIGTLLSGVMAGAVSGWIFAVAAFAGVWLGLFVLPRVAPVLAPR